MTVDALAARRDPSRPGPGPLPGSVLRALDLTIGRRVEGLLAGDYRSSRLGPGTELAQVRVYEPGDDVRMIDWNVTARTQVPHVRVHLAERVLTSWVVVDASASMRFGTADRRKADVAEGAALAIAHVATRRGNRLGVVSFGGAELRVLPPRQGRAGLLGMLTELGEEREPEDGATSFAAAFSRAAAVARQRALVAVISDFRGPLDWRPQLIQLAARHDVVAIEIRDPREQELPKMGELWLVDPETGRKLRVDTRSPRLRARFANAAADERSAVAATFTSVGVRHVVLPTEGDWLRVLVPFLRRGGARR
ncbi:MAG TPA: DUF58 domain-containing protein [Gaiellaceae bacterium]|nr:DUF58 domain-containing protein [Gaiellaceae bacterium]